MTALEELHLEQQQLQAEEFQWARRHLLLVEKGKVIQAFHQGVLSQAVQEKLLADIDGQLLGLESGVTEESSEGQSSPESADTPSTLELPQVNP